MAQQKVKIAIPKSYNPSQRKDIALDIITYIQERAINNRGFNPDTGREFKFPKYSKAYAEKKGSSRTDVDLVLSANMFNDMKALETATPGEVVIGFKAGTESNDKAEGNQLGTYGQDDPIPGKARPFLGLSKVALKEILAKYDPKK